MNDDLQFLNDLTKEEKTEEELKAEEEQRKKNKDAEEARKRREAEDRAKKEAEEEAKKKAEEDAKKKIEEEDKNQEEDLKKDAKKQVEDLKSKYPELDIKELDEDENFKAYRKGKWYKGGQTITELYEEYIEFVAKITKTEKEKVQKTYNKKSTPKIIGEGTGGDSAEDVYSKEELEALARKIPYMNSREYAKIEDKFDKSVKYYKKKG